MPGLLEELAGRGAELLLEHGGEGAGAVVAQLSGDVDDLLAQGDALQGQQQARLLAPLAEGHAGALLEQALDGLLVQAQAGAPVGQGNVAWFGLFAAFAIVVLYGLSRWYRHHLTLFKLKQGGVATHGLSAGRVKFALLILALLVFSKYFYMASFTSYFTFFLIEKFDLSVASSQLYLFLFLGAVAAGTFFGGPIGDRIGRKQVIWFSILGVAPFSLLLPHVDLFWTGVLSMLIGFILASAFSAIVVFAQELMPGNVGMIAGLFFGLMFGFGGIGGALLGYLADIHGIEEVFLLCSFLPLLGILTALLPSLKAR